MKKIAIAVAVIIAVIAVWKLAAPKAPVETPAEDVTPQLAEDVAIYIEDQKPGDVLMGDVVVLREPGFVVVHESTDENTIGAVIGSSALLPAGKNEDFTMQLARETDETETVYGMVYSDTNGNGVFDEGEDAPMRDTADNRVYTIFRTDRAE